MWALGRERERKGKKKKLWIRIRIRIRIVGLPSVFRRMGSG